MARQPITTVALVLATTAVAAVAVLRLVAGDPVPVARVAFFEGLRSPLNIAHRGASGERAEHSFAAYDLALAQGADVLELDVRMTKDGVIVVAHDKDIARVAGAPLVVAAATLAELRTAAGDKAPLPLAEVLERYPARLNVEIKEDRPEVALALAELLRSAKRETSVLVASFHAGVMEAFREASRGAVATSAHGREVVSFLVHRALGLPATPSYVALQIPRRVGSWLDLGDAAFITFAHAHGLDVQYWTIDDAAEMRALVAAGADGIMTNFPAVLERELTRD